MKEQTEEMEQIEEDQNTDQSKKIPKKWVSLIIGSSIVLLFSVAALGAIIWMKKNPPINELSSEEATKKVITKNLMIESGQYEGTVRFQWNEEGIANIPEVQNFASLIGLETIEDVSLGFTSSGDTSTQQGKGFFWIDLLSGEEKKSLQIDVLQTTLEMVFIKLSVPEELIELVNTEIGENVDISFINNTWIEIDIKKLAETFNLEEILREENMGSIEELTTPLPEEDVEKITNLLKEYPFFALGEQVGEEKIGDVETVQYRVEFDATIFEQFIIELIPVYLEIYEKNYNLSQEELLGEDITQEELIDVLEEEYDPLIVQTAVDLVIGNEAYVWVGKRDALIYKAALTITIPEEESPLQKVFLEMNISNHNKGMEELQAPEETMSIQEVIGTFGLQMQKASSTEETLLEEPETTTVPVTPVTIEEEQKSEPKKKKKEKEQEKN